MNFFISFSSFGGAWSSGSSAGPLSASNSSAGMLSCKISPVSCWLSLIISLFFSLQLGYVVVFL